MLTKYDENGRILIQLDLVLVTSKSYISKKKIWKILIIDGVTYVNNNNRKKRKEVNKMLLPFP